MMRDFEKEQFQFMAAIIAAGRHEARPEDNARESIAIAKEIVRQVDADPTIIERDR
jgi:hypothetical protein